MYFNITFFSRCSVTIDNQNKIHKYETYNLREPFVNLKLNRMFIGTSQFC